MTVSHSESKIDQKLDKKPTNQPYFDAEKYIREFENEIKIFNSIQTQFLKNKEVAGSQKNNLLSAFSLAIASYDDLKKKLISHNVVTAREIDAIEQSVIQAAQGTYFDKLLFYPPYQNEYRTSHHQPRTENQNQVTQLLNQRNTMFSHWEARDQGYVRFIKNTLIPSIFIVGLPFLFGGLIVAMADSIITGIRLFISDKKINRIQEESEVLHQTTQSTILEKIKQEPNGIVKQGFFNLAKARFEPKCKELEESLKKPKL